MHVAVINFEQVLFNYRSWTRRKCRCFPQLLEVSFLITQQLYCYESYFHMQPMQTKSN